MALKGARLKQCLTQVELAQILGVQQNKISSMEKEKRPIGKIMAKRLSEVLDVGWKVFL